MSSLLLPATWTNHKLPQVEIFDSNKSRAVDIAGDIHFGLCIVTGMEDYVSELM